jgi:type IV secretory pathway VirB2 component (pilin)
MSILNQIANGVIQAPDSLPQTTADSADTIKSLVTYSGVLAAAISVLIIVIAGVQLIISSGEPGKVSKARTAIVYAVVGLVVALSAVTITSFVGGSF